MKRLLLLRHAKAVTGSAKDGDHTRPLNDRGRADTPRIAIAMQHSHYIPDLVLCSTAKRTAETWAHMAPELDVQPEVNFLDILYLASWKTIAQTVRAVSGNPNVVLVIGHNPGIEDFAQAAARQPQSDRERALMETLKAKFPTAALAVLDFDFESWSDLAAGSGALVDFIRPKDLTDE
jgi:phosphohistidine phosphatase